MMLTGLSSLAVRLGGLLSTFLLGVLLARLLGPGNYGIYGAVVAASALAMTLSHLGTYQLAVRELSVRASRSDWVGARTIALQFLVVAGSASIFLGLASILGAMFGFGPASRELYYVILGAILTVLLTISTLLASELRGLGALIKGQFFEFLGRPVLSLAGLLLIIAIAFSVPAIWALWLQIAAAALALIVSAAWLGRALPRDGGTSATKRNFSWLKAALPLGAVDLLRQLDGSYGILLMAVFAPAADVGIFRVAIACAALLGMPAAALHMILAPKVARLHAAGERLELQTILRESSAALLIILLPVTLLVGLFGEPVIVTVFGPAYAGAATPLFIFACAQTVICFFGMGPVLLAMADNEWHLIKIYLGSVVAAMAAAVPLVMLFGANGAAFAQIISFGAIGFFSWRFARRTLGLELTFFK